MKLKKALIWFVLLLITACSHKSPENQQTASIFLEYDEMKVTATPFQPENEVTAILEEISPAVLVTTTPEAGEDETLLFSIGESVPAYLFEAIQDEKITHTQEGDTEADLFLFQGDSCDAPVFFVYVLVAPFPTVTDSIRLKTLESAWSTNQEIFNNKPLLMSQGTYAVFAEAWGEAKSGAVAIKNRSELIEAAWDGDQYAIVPFEELDARWKVIQIDGKSVLDKSVENPSYPLSFAFCLEGTAEALEQIYEEDDVIEHFVSNRDLAKLTSVTMTGVTALVRATANKMENLGVTYPGEKIRPLLLAADFTHISNEVAFANDCPYPDPYQTGLRFCSSPKYLELFEYLDIDIIELTGNHIQDWGREPFIETLGLYEQGGYLYYAGGRNLEEAKEPLLIDHNGNKLAFVGCNAVGPSNAFATEDLSGNAYCGDYGWIQQSVKDLTEDGYLVIVTLQHNEFYGLTKTGPQMRDFNPIAKAGAVIVSGSQAHYPNPFGFEGNHFIHYGLGNLFFDQMDVYIAAGIQREFVDTHYFYNGNYISTEIYTLYLEDFAQPRMMTEEERRLFLEETFSASGW